MTKQMMSFEEAALMLAETATGMSQEEFADFARDVLADNTSDEIATIAAYLPADLQALLPRPTLHP
jgi:uncharacterized protein YqeY